MVGCSLGVGIRIVDVREGLVGVWGCGGSWWRPGFVWVPSIVALMDYKFLRIDVCNP